MMATPLKISIQKIRDALVTRERCDGRALDRVSQQKHRTTRQKLSKTCPKIVFSAPLDYFLDIFQTFFDVFRRFCRHSLPFPTICPLQRERVTPQQILIELVSVCSRGRPAAKTLCQTNGIANVTNRYVIFSKPAAIYRSAFGARA